MNVDRVYENYYQQLQSIFQKILSFMHDFSVLFSMDKFMRFILMFQKDKIKIDIGKAMFESFARYQMEPTSDAVILGAMMYMGKVMIREMRDT